MAEYCAEDDLIKIRPNIMGLGVDDWSDQISKAGVIIDRAIDTFWYRRIAEENDIDWRTSVFNRDLLLSAATQLTDLGCYKTLELCYRYLMKDTKEADAYERQSELFKKLYEEELSDVLDSGVDYDWDESGAVDEGENIIPQVRRLVRV